VLDLNGEMSKVLCETDNSGNIIAYYIYGAGLLYKITASEERYQYHFDPLGSTVALTNENETITDMYAYDPFGTLVNSVGTTENPFRYIGQYGVMDEENGLIFMRARFYDSKTKRFISRDPVKSDISNTNRNNMYIYSGNNPIIYIDPEGTKYFEGREPLSRPGYGNYFYESWNISLELLKGGGLGYETYTNLETGEVKRYLVLRGEFGIGGALTYENYYTNSPPPETKIIDPDESIFIDRNPEEFTYFSEFHLATTGIRGDAKEGNRIIHGLGADASLGISLSIDLSSLKLSPKTMISIGHLFSASTIR
jgi:RHS repeat-associated protein